ncbi:hypothetical protein FDP41_002633 [Naegleria fowleri]|uniref:PB1 domain-containing protein n=1 Tax=Naegleria fowleri TaxID=5763 RepID=A0A6A5BW61_NAEFO|nr:uncharacterized protein FDP41_002633 [Naegleria fowleri]KAF0978118.1 hypothetical protein FDP41_002633 [Naegleria fowleri]
MLSQQQQQGSSTTTTVNIKAKYKDSIRRLPIHSSLTLDQLLQVLSTSFHATITRENSVIKYKDDECDLITTTNEEEWKEAVRNFSSPVLYLEIVEKKVVTKASSTPPVATTTQQPSKPSSVQPQQTPQFSMNLPNQSGGSNIALMQQKQQPQQPVVTTGSSSPPPQQQQEQKPQTPTQQQQQKPETNVPPQQVIQVQPQQQPSTIIPPQQQPSQQVPPPQPQQPSQNVEHSWSFAAVNTSVDATNWSSKFVRDVNLTDGSSVIVNQPVTKAWALKNTGTTQWPDNICLFCKDENPTYEILGSQVPRALPGQDVEASVTFIPKKIGNIKGYFRLAAGKSQFGHLCWFELNVMPQVSQQQQPQMQPPIQPVVPTIPQQVPPPQSQQKQQLPPRNDLSIEGIHDVSDDEEDLEEFEQSRMQALYEKYSLQLYNLEQCGILEGRNKDELVEILEANNGDWMKAMQECITRSSQIF